MVCFSRRRHPALDLGELLFGQEVVGMRGSRWRSGVTASGPDRVLARIRAGDHSAMEELFDRFAAPVYQTALSVTGDRVAADAVTTTVFLEVWRDAGALLDGSTGVRAWLVGMARAAAHDQRPHPGHTRGEDSAAESGRRGERRGDSSRSLRAEAGRLWAVSAIAILPPEERRVLEDVLFARDTLDQAAARYQLSVADAAAHLTSALRRLTTFARTAPAPHHG